jgi:hypothetical protein
MDNSFTDALIADIIGVSVKSIENWRLRGFLPKPRTGDIADVAAAYVVNVVSELGVHLDTAGWVAAKVVPALLGDAPPARMTISTSPRVMLVLDVAQLATELKTRIAEAQRRKDLRDVA